jgi:hypothetical protein
LPATDALLEDGPDEKPVLLLLRRSCTATFGTKGIGSFRCVPSDLDMMSLILMPLLLLGVY